MNHKALLMMALMLMVTASPLVTPVSAQLEDIEVLEMVVNPANNHTYYLLTASSWTDAAQVARSLDGFLVTVNDEAEDQWLFDTFATDGDITRHIWIGLTDQNAEGEFRWHDGTPFLYRNWGDGQPDEGNDEDYVHITGTNMGSIDPATWNDLEDDPQYFPVYGVVEVGEGADYALRFDGDDDYLIAEHDEGLIIENDLFISAWVKPYTANGNQFIVMKGDYGWGMYLSNGNLAYSSQYSLSQHPKSNFTVPINQWSMVSIHVTNQSITFTLDNVSESPIALEDHQIPQGDFGSNDCYQSGEACDEFYIGRMGAGCDCSYFYGLMDDIEISSSNQSISDWSFPEGEGATTLDNSNRTANINGAAWVMPDGTIIAQAIEVKNGITVSSLSAQPGDTLLFFVEIPENTRYVQLTVYAWDNWGDEENEEEFQEIEMNIYIANNRIPTAWDHDDIVDGWGYYSYGYYEWPEAGTWWMTITTKTGFNNAELSAYWEEAPTPPELDDMTELKNGIAVTDQGIGRNSDTKSLYYYVDVVEPLTELSVKTFGGDGQCDLHIAWKVLPWDDFGQPW
ncbi:MAG TPA: hypothetical protein EYG33_05695, partial [Candidatus Poseidoniales archaeon]|nr:hypothetical protein [Candidatus Poseidoniales archaeon]